MSIFQKIIDREIPATILYEDNEIIAFNDIDPKAPVHFLVIPKKEIKTLNEITAEDIPLIGKLFFVASKIALELGFAQNGYRTVFNCNKDAGQTVFHIHLHVLAGRQLDWPPG